MKIESSSVQVNAQSFSELSSTAQTSFDFKQTLLGFVSKEGEAPIQNSSVQETQKKIEEQMRAIKDEIAKMMLEIILIRFLGIDPKKAKEKASQQCQFNPSQNNQMPKKAVIKTDYDYHRGPLKSLDKRFKWKR